MQMEEMLVHNPVFVDGLGWCKLVAFSPYVHTVSDKVTIRIVQVKPPLQENRTTK